MDTGKKMAASKTRSDALKHDGGFALVLLLSLLPLLITSLLGVAALLPMMSKLREAEDLCRKGALNSQARLLRGLGELLTLSEAAEKLYQLEMKALKLKRASVAHPAAYKAASTLLETIRTAQRSLNAAGRAVRLRTDFGARRILQSVGQSMESSQRYLGHSFLASGFRGQGARVQVQVEQKGSSDIYHPHRRLEDLQVVTGSWGFKPLAHFESWTLAFFPELGPLKIQCAAGALKKGENQWEPILIAVKRQLRS